MLSLQRLFSPRAGCSKALSAAVTAALLTRVTPREGSQVQCVVGEVRVHPKVIIS